MRLCIISDLHCKYQLDVNSPSDTLLFSNKRRIPASQHPVVAMLQAIDIDSDINADMLLCLGDLGDKADEQGILSAWQSVDEIQRKMKISSKIGIPGNHDVNSRKKNGVDAFTFIQNFHETFPTNDENLNSAFWGRGFCIQIIGEVLYLLINTVHDHEDEDKAKESSLTPQTLERISSLLEKSIAENIKYKVCMLHHHPIKHSNIQNYKDSDSLEKGDVLLELLNKFGFNIVLHGHKHQPRIFEQNGLAVLAAGSFSSFANLQGTGLNNMFHVVELSEHNKTGTIHSWEYNVKDGWTKSNNKNFPSKIGFGANLDLDDVAGKIKDIVSKESKPVFYSEIINEIPDLQYLVPDKLIQLGKILKTHQLAVNPEYPQEPYIVTLIH